MSWTGAHRRAADRIELRYPNYMTDAEWVLVQPLIRPIKRGGRPQTVVAREVLSAILYLLWPRCQWRMMLKDLLPRSRRRAISS